jgi:PadR family transcriptional regulator, regulatory protein PadR
VPADAHHDRVLVRLEQKGWIKGVWQTTDKVRPAKLYAIARAGTRARRDETARWRPLTSLVDKLLDEPQS